MWPEKLNGAAHGLGICAEIGGEALLGGAYELIVLDFDEVAFRIALEAGSGGAVGFVADDEVERGEAVQTLSAGDDVERVVGGEDDAHVLGVVAFCHFHGEALGIGGGGVAEFVGEGWRNTMDDGILALPVGALVWQMKVMTAGACTLVF